MGNSSSTPSSSTTTTTTHGEYDVFLSFRGTDTRKTFTCHLYQALDEKKITTFIDDKLVRGEEISDGLWRAIGESKISVIIFSENYAFSKWCLRELAEIMKYREKNNQIVIPVFYQVDPSHVRKQIGSYEAAFAKHEKGDKVLVSFCFLLLFSSLAAVFSCFFFGWLRLCLLFLFFWAGVLGTLSLYPVFCCCLWASLPPIIDMTVQKKEDEVKKWREALTRASNISGWDSAVARTDSGLVSDIVSVVWNKLNNISPLCNFEDLVKDLDKYLVGIEKHIAGVVSKLCLEVQDIRIIGIWGMAGIGKTTIADAVFKIISNQFENRTYFTGNVREESENGLIRLRNEILSEVLNIENKKSGNRSIPRRIKEMLKQKKVLIVLDDVDTVEQLKILAEGLDQFGSGSRIILTTRDKQILDYYNVKDHNMYEVKELNQGEALQLFCNHAFKQNHPIEGFEGLSREMVKIATNVPLAVTVLGSSLYKRSKQHWKDVVDQFQVIMNPTIFDRLKISYNRLDEKERGLFLDIACFVEFQFRRDEEDFPPNLSSNRTSFLEHLIDKSLVTVEHGCIKMHDLLREMGRKIVDEESLNKPGDHSRLWRQEDVLRMLEHNDGITNAVQGILLKLYNIEDKHLISQAIVKMYNLRTLIIKGSDTIGGLDYLPDQLRYLHWQMYPLEELPSSFIPKNLLELDLSYSKIKQLWKGSTDVPKLKRLKLNDCRNLIRIPDLSYLPLVESINLSDCCELESFPDILEGMKLKYLNLSGTAIKELPPSIGYLNKLDLTRCCKLESFPDILEGMELKNLNLRETAIKELPPSIGNLNQLQQLVFSGCKSLERLPKSIKILSKLYSLKLDDCGMLQSLPELPSSLRRLVARNCKQLIQSLPDESEFEQAINCEQLIQSFTDESKFFFRTSAIGSLYFNFINCLKMNQKAVSNLLIFFRDSVVLKMQRMGTEKIISLFERDERKVVEGSIFLPGSEIPKWFSYKNNGSSRNIPGLRNDCGRSIMGFAVCLVIGFDSDIRFLKVNGVRYDFHIETRDGHKEGFFHEFPWFRMPSKDEFSYSDHIFLGYNLSSECYELFQKLDTLLANHGMSDYVGTSFAFRCCGGHYKVKHCGIQPIYVRSQVMNSDAINQDTCESDDTEETCESDAINQDTCESDDTEETCESDDNCESDDTEETCESDDNAINQDTCESDDTEETCESDDTEETCELHPKRI